MTVLDEEDFLDDEKPVNLFVEHAKAEKIVKGVLERISLRENCYNFINYVDSANLLSPNSNDNERKIALQKHFDYSLLDLNPKQYYMVLRRKYEECKQVLRKQ